MTLDELRKFVRSVMLLDVIDLPDSLLNVYARAGFRKVRFANPRWPWLEAEWTFILSAGAGSYPLVQVGSDVDSVRQVRVSSTSPRILSYVGPEQAERRWATGVSSGNVREWSMWGGNLSVWPTPSSNEVLTVRGYRVPADFVAQGAGGVPDCPEPFHEVIAEWMLSEAYGRLEDPQMAGLWASKFADDLALLERNVMQAPPAEPVVLAGSSVAPARPPYPFPWE